MLETVSAVVPVLDLMIGQVVLAQAGNRDSYRPVHSKLTCSSQPLQVAQAIFNQTGCDCLYLADIDSFAGANPNWDTYNSLLERGFRLLIDADWLTQKHCDTIFERISEPKNLQVILSTETLTSIEQFKTLELFAKAGIEPIFSIDQKGSAVITRPGELAARSGLELAQLACEHGVESLILLNLERVGSYNGVESEELGLLAELRQRLPDVRLISGGGVRNIEDVQRLLNLGCQHVLVASAIHDCRLTPDEIGRLEASTR